MAYYKSKKLWRILVGSNDLQKLLDLGFSPKRLIIDKHTPQRNATQFVKISKITDNNRKDKTFCFNEPLRHAGIFNGVIASNCTEIIEYSDSKEYAVCNLASIALSKFVVQKQVDWKDVKVFTKDKCNWCVLVKGLLREKHIEFTEVHLEEHEYKDFFKEYGVTTLPQVYQKDKRIGGYDDTWEALKPEFDFAHLEKVTKMITRNLNKIIDINYYPLIETKRSNLKHRPIGIGVQGLADTFVQMRLPFDSDDAKNLNKLIFETIYYASLCQSNTIAKNRERKIEEFRNYFQINYEDQRIPELYDPEWSHLDFSVNDAYHQIRPIRAEIERNSHFGSYSSFNNSPLYFGKFQFDLWGQSKNVSGRYDWDALRESIQKHGTRNSLLMAPMPTASTSQILGNNECIEPYTSNMYTRRTIAGEFTIINKWLIRDLVYMGLWNDDMAEKLMYYRGSVQKIKQVPDLMKNIYKTAWELKQRHLIDQAADRGIYIDQSQSLNIFIPKPTFKILTKCHFYGWEKGLKTGSYYIRSKPAMNAQTFTIDPEKVKQYLREEQEMVQECLTCSS
jgi:ribonucleotide reductase alpha subunit